MSAKAKITFEQVEQKRRTFSAALREFRNQKGQYHNPAPELPQSKVADCTVLANRELLFGKLPTGGTIAKIGVDRGDFVPEMLDMCQPARLHLLDKDVSRLSNPKIRAEMASATNRLKIHIGDTDVTMAKLPNAYFDAVYIDGDHEYSAVLHDITVVLPKLKPGGALIFSDYTVWSAASMFHCGVARAVNEFVLMNAWKFRFMALQPMMYNHVMLVAE